MAEAGDVMLSVLIIMDAPTAVGSSDLLDCVNLTTLPSVPSGRAPKSPATFDSAKRPQAND